MRLGAKSLLIGVHQFALHPILVAVAWTKLYGIPWNPKLWLCFLVHDWGYWYCTDIDGDSGKNHPAFGATLVHKLCDTTQQCTLSLTDQSFAHDLTAAHILEGVDTAVLHISEREVTYRIRSREWHDFCLFHSRFAAEKAQVPFSRLCVADKLATALLPTWLFILLATLSGEMKEFEARAAERDDGYTPNAGRSRSFWIRETREKFRRWAYENKDKALDAV